MHKYILLVALCQVNSLLLGQALATDPQLAKVESQYFNALKNKNYTGLDTIHHDLFHGVLATGKKLDKAAMIAYQNSNDAYVMKSFESLEVKTFGDVAVYTGIEVNKAKTGTILGQIRFIRIFARKNNAWTLTHAQFTAII